MLDNKFFERVGPVARDLYRKHIFTKAKDVFGKTFKGYSTRGSKWVTMNVKDQYKKNAPKKGYSYAQAKQGNMLRRQRSKYRNSTAPVVSGDLLNDFGSYFDTKDDRLQFGWSIQGAKVKWLAKMGRVLTSKKQALPKSVINYLLQAATRYVRRKMKPKKSITRYKIGK